MTESTMATIMYSSLTKSQSMRTKRKSAVELLAESKPFYVKSEVVRDNKQTLPIRPASNFLSYGTYHRDKSSVMSQANQTTPGMFCRSTNMTQFLAVSPSRSLPPLPHRRSIHSTNSVYSGNGDLLQNKLRQLLVCDSAEELSIEKLGPLSPPEEYSQRCHKSLPDLHCREPSSNKSSNKSLSNRDSGGSSGHYTQRSEPTTQLPKEYRRDSGSSTQHSGGYSAYCYMGPDNSDKKTHLPSTFKRQKCLRYKRDRPILRSKSDICDRYWRPPESSRTHLEQFFEHLGLTYDSYEDMLSNSPSSESPVYFSEKSSIDSNSSRPVDNIECCTTSRLNEAPSIVERNARIIKWLCNCRKSQLT